MPRGESPASIDFWCGFHLTKYRVVIRFQPLQDLAKVLPLVPARAKNAVVRFFAVPMCVLGEHAMLSNDLHWDPRVTVEWGSAPGKVVFDGIYSWAPDRKRTLVDACQGCSKNQLCMGVFEKYAELWSVESLQPG